MRYLTLLTDRKLGIVGAVRDSEHLKRKYKYEKLQEIENRSIFKKIFLTTVKINNVQIVFLQQSCIPHRLSATLLST